MSQKKTTISFEGYPYPLVPFELGKYPGSVKDAAVLKSFLRKLPSSIRTRIVNKLDGMNSMVHDYKSTLAKRMADVAASERRVSEASAKLHKDAEDIKNARVILEGLKAIGAVLMEGKMQAYQKAQQ